MAASGEMVKCDDGFQPLPQENEKYASMFFIF